MKKDNKSQLTLDFEAGLSTCYSTGRELLQERVHMQGRQQKAIAADMDLSPSQLTRKLAQSPNDSARLTLDDAELFMTVTKDFKLVEYWIDRFLVNAQLSELDQLKAKIAELEAQKLKVA